MGLKDVQISGDDFALLLGVLVTEIVEALALPGGEVAALDDVSQRVRNLAEEAVIPKYSDVLRMVADILGGRATVHD